MYHWRASFLEDVHLVELLDLILTHMSAESHHRQFRSFVVLFMGRLLSTSELPLYTHTPKSVDRRSCLGLSVFYI